MGTPPCLSVIFTKGKHFYDFLFQSQGDITLIKRSLLVKGILYELIPIEEMGDKNENGRAESVPIHLNKNCD